MGTGGNNAPLIIERERVYSLGNGQANQMKKLSKIARTLDCMDGVQIILVKESS